MPKANETNHEWISGSSRSVEEICRAAFFAGIETGEASRGMGTDHIPEFMQRRYFQEWLTETRTERDDTNMHEPNLQGGNHIPD